ncbi:DUF4136 domain-containing protein [Sphingorhabdus sp. Alg231-15]|uniref:DUF4136 domain-containing protein n=1 Tax=Sphingorhabdus sp. Alg231-15 TaxID=1922222 RepID=UPI000D558AA8
MHRLVILMIPILALTASCGGPIETRIQTEAAAALPAQKQYSFTAKPEQNSKTYDKARNLVAQALTGKNFVAVESASVIVHIALANRPASIAMTTGEKENIVRIADQKEQKFLQSCEDFEHRLTINMINSTNGSTLYSGTAAEYHCNGTFDQSLPHLIDAALSDLGGASAKPPNSRIRIRTGIE